MTTLRLCENFRGLLYAPFYAAEAIGAYREAGLTLELVSSSDPAASAAALRAGDVDVMWGGPLRVLMTYDRDPAADLICFGEVVARDPFFLVGREPRPDFRPADLTRYRFASVAEVPTPWICLAHDLRLAGVDPDRLPRIADRNMAANVAALGEGAVDVIQVFEPWAERLLRSRGHIWYAAADRGLTAYTCFVTRKPTLARRRDEMAALARAIARTLAWVHATSGGEIAATVGRYFPETEPGLIAGAAERYKALGVWGRDGVLRQEGFDWLQAAMLAAGTIRRAGSYAACVDTTLLDPA